MLVAIPIDLTNAVVVEFHPLQDHPSILQKNGERYHLMFGKVSPRPRRRKAEAEVEKKKSDALIKARKKRRRRKKIRNHLNQNPKVKETTTLQV